MAKPVVLALVPCRRGSKGKPGKNILPFAGGPSCVERAIACAKASGVCDRILVSTDDPEAVRQAEAAGVEVHQRSADAASDTATINDVISNLMCDHALDGVDIVVLLQPTSPLRHPSVIDRAVLLLQELRASAVVSVQPLDGHEPHLSRILRQTGPYLHPVGYGWDIRRQDASLGHYRDGQVYAFWVDTWRLYRHIYGEHVRPLICAAADALSIDTEADWQEAERRIREREGP